MNTGIAVISSLLASNSDCCWLTRGNTADTVVHRYYYQNLFYPACPNAFMKNAIHLLSVD